MLPWLAAGQIKFEGPSDMHVLGGGTVYPGQYGRRVTQGLIVAAPRPLGHILSVTHSFSLGAAGF